MGMIPHVSISGYAGAGKSTISRILASRHRTLWVPRVTCREMRLEETPRTEYFFIGLRAFLDRMKPLLMEVHPLDDGTFTGILKPQYWPQPEANTELILSVFGSHAPEIKEIFPELVTIFLEADEDDLKRRLFYRGNEVLYQHLRRNQDYRDQGLAAEYDYVLRNDGTPEECVEKIEKLVGLPLPSHSISVS